MLMFKYGEEKIYILVVFEILDDMVQYNVEVAVDVEIDVYVDIEVGVEVEVARGVDC